MRILICLAMLVTATTYARLGETLEQLTARYGTPIGSTPIPNIEATSYTFSKNNVRVYANVYGGVCTMISFESLSDEGFTNKERMTLRDVNYPSKWTKTDGNRQDETYVSADGKIELRLEKKLVRLTNIAYRAEVIRLDTEAAEARKKAYEAAKAEREAKLAAEKAKGLQGF